MEIDPAMPKDAGYYECQSDNKFSIDRRGFIAKYELNWIELNVVSVEKVWYGSKIKQWFGKLCLLLFGNHTKLYILL